MAERSVIMADFDCCGNVLTPQEMRIEGVQCDASEGRERTFRRIEEIRQSPVVVCADRARLFTESFKATEGRPMVLRWALALKHIAENIPINIGKDDLIVGRGDSHPGKYGILYPEVDGAYMDCLRGQLSQRAESPFDLSDEVAKLLEEEISPYWKGKTFPEKYPMSLPEETRKMIFGPNPDNIIQQLGIVMVTSTMRSSINYTHDYANVLTRGIKDIKREAQEKLTAITNPIELAEKEPFLKAVMITGDAIVAWANRYAKVAREMAENEDNPNRRNELLEIAEICEWVPENPARTFQEALQAQWFTHIFSRLEHNVGAALGNGRMDQYLYPYYCKDIAEGRLTPDKAKELFESLWLNLSEAMIIFVTPTGGGMTEGYAHFEGVTLGGRTREGKDATNELSYLILESKRGLPINYPDLGVRIHAQTPDRFLKNVCEIIKEGQGYPKLLNDEEVIPLYLAKGVAYEDALDYAISGCVENRIPSVDTYINPCGALNMAAALEMALHDGRIKFFSKYQFGLTTGDPREFAVFDDLMNAYKVQYLNMLKHLVAQQAVVDKLKTEFFAAPFTSMIHKLCEEQSQDINGYVSGGFREQYHDAIGFATVIDSLVAVKKLVYDDKKLTMDELLEALDTNFEGKEAIRQMCLNTPKYGNNDPYVDSVGLEIEKIHMNYLKEINGTNGLQLSMRMIPLTAHILMGKIIGATPNGRKAGQYLAEGTSASHGADVKGPTSSLISNANTKNQGYNNRQARLLNVKLSPGTVKGEEGTRKLMSFIRTWNDLKLYHIQFNIINRETLLAAQQDPEKYRNLVVRVAGYSAYFTELTPELQNEIIARTEHSF